MLQKLSSEILECYDHADECRQRAKEAFTDGSRQDFLDMEQRWLSLAHSYEFAERLSNFVAPFRNRRKLKATSVGGLAPRAPEGHKEPPGPH
jgi:hypothetical protein